MGGVRGGRMFTIYPQIANRLRSIVTDLGTIDYDYGQLASPEQAAPMDYPAVLVSIESAKWAETGQKVQKGSLVIAVTVGHTANHYEYRANGSQPVAIPRHDATRKRCVYSFNGV